MFQRKGRTDTHGRTTRAREREMATEVKRIMGRTRHLMFACLICCTSSCFWRTIGASFEKYSSNSVSSSCGRFAISREREPRRYALAGNTQSIAHGRGPRSPAAPADGSSATYQQRFQLLDRQRFQVVLYPCQRPLANTLRAHRSDKFGFLV